MAEWLVDGYPDLANVANSNGNLAIHFAAAQGIHNYRLDYYITVVCSRSFPTIVNTDLLHVAMCVYGIHFSRDQCGKCVVSVYLPLLH